MGQTLDPSEAGGLGCRAAREEETGRGTCPSSLGDSASLGHVLSTPPPLERKGEAPSANVVASVLLQPRPCTRQEGHRWLVNCRYEPPKCEAVWCGQVGCDATIRCSCADPPAQALGVVEGKPVPQEAGYIGDGAGQHQRPLALYAISSGVDPVARTAGVVT